MKLSLTSIYLFITISLTAMQQNYKKLKFTSAKEEPKTELEIKKDKADALQIFWVITELLKQEKKIYSLTLEEPVFKADPSWPNSALSIKIDVDQSQWTKGFNVSIDSPAGACTIANGNSDSFFNLDFSQTAVKLLYTLSGFDYGEAYGTYYVELRPQTELMQ